MESVSATLNEVTSGVNEITSEVTTGVDGLGTFSSMQAPSDPASPFSSLIWFTSWLFFKTINWLVLYIPGLIINVLSTNFQISLTLSSLLLYLFLIVSICFLIVRYKYLTRYSKSTSDSNIKVSKGMDLVDSLNSKKRKKEASTNYLDEFLSAIKVFGYLEKPVFHELTKSMTTQKLVADEILYLDESLGFSIVVEGTLQVYTKVDGTSESEGLLTNLLAKSDYDDNGLNFEKDDTLTIGTQRYQLLNEVKSGASLSSLISTLDLFKPEEIDQKETERDQKEDQKETEKETEYNLNHGTNQNNLKGKSNYHFLDNSNYESNSLPRASFDLLNESASSSVPVSPQNKPDPFEKSFGTEKSFEKSSIYPHIVAKPKPYDPSESRNKGTGTATIAIIPRHAFQRVQAKYPKATSHIVTMVLTRLYKVTMNAIHNYLGLTKEIIESEIQLNESVESTVLPRYLYEGVVEKFYHKNGSFNKTSSLSSKSSSSNLPKRIPSSTSKNSSRYVVLDLRSKSSHPGDLLSSVPLSRRSDYYQSHTPNYTENKSPPVEKRPKTTTSRPNLNTNPSTSINTSKENIRNRTFSDEREETEETSLRIAIVENIFKHLGIDEINNTMNLNPDLSSQSSSQVGLSSLMSEKDLRRLSSYESKAGWPKFDGRPSTPTKFFSTINQSELKAPEHSTHKTTRSSTGSPVASYDGIYNVKNKFSKVLDIKYIEPNTTLVEQGSFNSGLYYVIDGSLDVLYHPVINEGSFSSNKAKTKKLYTVKQGGLAGYLTSVVGFRSMVSIKTAANNKGVIVAHIHQGDFRKLIDKFHFLLLPIASKLKELLSRQILTIDFALEWCHIPAGELLSSQGDLANGFHIVLSGRFRKIRNPEKEDVDNNNLIDESNSPQHLQHKGKEEVEVLGEYGHNESIGEVEVLTASRRSYSLIAVRDSETTRIPRTLFEMLSLQNPSLMVKVSRIVANKFSSLDKDTPRNPTYVGSSTVPHISNDYKTITILPTTTGLPVREFADKLVQALKTIGRNVIALDQASILTHLGRHAFDERLAQLKLSGYFAYLEERYETIVYVCDTQLKSNWTSTCISQGDCILLLADAEDDVIAQGVGDYERLLIQLKTTARTDLCLIHQDKSVIPGSTSIWLKNRLWVHGHHHIEMEFARSREEPKKDEGSRIMTGLAAKLNSNPNIKLRFENVKSKALESLVKLNSRIHRTNHYQFKSQQSHKNDFLRLARILSNEAVGLVLGGGGSRGISHVGVVQALERHGIPVDLIGGTSIGSFVGGLYAKDYNIVSIYGRAKKFSKRVASVWRSIFDLTYPVTSYITGYEFNRGIWKVFGSTEIEDFWIKYFCNSTNITNSTMDIHENGYLWRFIRASMSLAGLLPPIAFNGCMLLDGGYLDNLPVMEMKKKGAKYIIAVDVGSADDRTPMNYGDTLSGFWVLFNRWNPFSKHPDVPNMMDIQMRLAYVASVNALELAKKTPGVIYLRPPIDNYATLDFAKFDEIYHVGLAYADSVFTAWEEKGVFPTIAGMVDKTKKSSEIRSLYRRNSI